MRHVFVGIDLSTSILSKDVEPSRLRVVRESLINFVNKFFELNPLSAVSLTFQNFVLIFFYINRWV